MVPNSKLGAAEAIASVEAHPLILPPFCESEDGEKACVYGARRVHAQLRQHGHQIARDTIARLMRAAERHGVSKRKGPKTTLPGPIRIGPRIWSNER